NAVSPLADAKLAGVPIVIVTSSIRQDEAGKGYPQDMDQMSVVRPLCSWAHTVRDTADVPTWVEAAHRNAVDLRGPALLEVPLDVVGTERDIVLMFGNLAPQAELIWIDADAERVVRHKQPDIAVVGDEAKALEQLASVVAPQPGRDAWLEELHDAGREVEPPL